MQSVVKTIRRVAARSAARAPKTSSATRRTQTFQAKRFYSAPAVNVTIYQKPPMEQKAVVIFYTEEEAAELASQYGHPALKEDLKGKPASVSLVYPQDLSGSASAGRHILVGLGKSEEIKLKGIRKAMSAALGRLQQLKLSTAVFRLPTTSAAAPEHIVDALTRMTVLSGYKFDTYITKEDNKIVALQDLGVEVNPATDVAMIEARAKEAKIIAEATNFARELGNERGEVAHPEWYEQQAHKLVSQYPGKLHIKVIQQPELKRLGMNLLNAVGQGATVPPRLVLLEYNGNSGSQERIALVGKGITFDTGGQNHKGTGFIEDMYTDNCGAAAVLGAFKAMCELDINQNVVGALCLAENAIGEKAMLPSAIIKSYKGLTVEIKNTDAEGRLVLADGFTYVQKHYNPKIMLDLATLTGACMIALGDCAAGLFTNDDGLRDQLLKASESTTVETLWPLPILDAHKEEIKGAEADLNNMGKGRYGGASTAAAFLQEFVEKDVKWAHLDIAGPSHIKDKRDFMNGGATGFGVQTLVQWLKSQ